VSAGRDGAADAARGSLERRSIGAATFVALGALIIGLTILSDHALRGARLDLTENRLYTLSPGTLHLMAGLKEPLNLYFFFSHEAAAGTPPLRAYAARVREVLEELASRSGGRIRLHVVDPLPFSEDEDRAAEFGLRPVQLGAGGEAVYFGLGGTNSTDGRAVIEFFQPQKEAFLEYDLARLVHQLAAPRRKVVGLVSSLPLTGGFDPASGGVRPPWAVESQIAELFDVRPVAADASALPSGLDALMVVHPKGLSPALSYAIDQYVVGGGRLLLFVDPDAQQDPGGAERAARYAGSDHSSTFEPMLAAWGVGFDPRQAVGDLEHALLVGAAPGAPAERHLAFAGFSGESLNHDDVVTASLETLNFGTPGFLEPRVVEGARFEPLVSTGTHAAPIGTERLAMAATPDSLREGFKPTGKRYVIAARVSGRLPSAYPGGPPPGVTPAAPALKAGAQPAHLVIVADTDVLADLLWVRTQTVLGQRFAEPWANNGDFVLNALDNLTGSADLIGIRGRASFARPFTRVEQLRARADERLRAKEVELQRELAGTEQKLVELQSRRQDQGSLALTPEQQRALERFQQEKVRIRKELRSVRRGLDEEIERLGTRLKLANVLAIPLLLSVAALVAAALRRRRRRAPPGAVA
jgi:ABC-type uncharacterized transport system involved in gliding motility auxiliary subunit